ncbi:MAG: hypothetical protein EXS05_07655 [Planctomycetaceae bacterium]|nr:hypothetical protein [Planctomycetaceae bacterium]
MSWPPDLTALLPAPRDDEPPELRQRIVAELRDHLQCAFQRELLLSGDETEANRRVLAKFGDPARLVRKLWFDALWEKIMSQRLMLACAAVMAAACITMGIVTVRVAEQSAQATQSLAEQGREVNAALLQQLDRMTTTSESDRSLNWIRVKVRLVQETMDGPPAEGFKVRIDDEAPNHMTSIAEKRQSTAEPEIDFGLLAPGRYNLNITAPWGDNFIRTFYVRPGESPLVQTVVCPAPPVEGDIAIDVTWPDDLVNKPIGLFCFVYSPQRDLSNDTWHSGPYAKSNSVLITSSGDLIPGGEGYIDDSEGPRLRVTDSAPLPNALIRSTGGARSLEVAGVVLMSQPEQRTETNYWPMVLLARRERNRNRSSSMPVTVFPESMIVKGGTVNHWKVTLSDVHFEAIRAALRERAEEQP